MPGNHAILSPSGFKALMLCPAKPAMERGLPDDSSAYADEGTAAHFLGSSYLERTVASTDSSRVADYCGEAILVTESHVGWWQPGDKGSIFHVTADMAEAVQVYIDTVKQYQGDGELFVEQSLPIDHITGEEGAEGTGDAVILRGDELIVIDLKFGKGVEVDAKDNPQLMLYGLGALAKFDLVGDINRVRMVVSQPRIRPEPSEWVMSADELGLWGSNVAQVAASDAQALYDGRTSGAPELYAKPHPEACRFCKAKGTCPALAASVQQSLAAEFTDLTTKDAIAQEEIVKHLVRDVPDENLGAKMDAVELVEMWCKAIRARCESVLLAGAQVAGYKLVPGKKGARAWADNKQAEAMLKKSFRLKNDVMYELSLISPTQAEKVLKPTPKRWAKLAPLIKQNDGKPSVAPVSDSRPALEIKPVEAEFEAITDTAEDLV